MPLNNYIIASFLALLMIVGNQSQAQRKKSFSTFHSNLKTSIENQDYEESLATLEENDQYRKGKNRLVYYMETGAMLYYLDRFEESNAYFQKADYYIEDYQKKIGNVLLSSLSNPYASGYKGEDFEALFINYYKALNYIALNQNDEALVEVKRMNILLNLMNDIYPQNKYDKDAFIHLVMGLIYDANESYNDAFIAYKNAYKIYREDYKNEYNLDVPKQLIADIARTAKLSGFGEDYKQFKYLLNDSNLLMEKSSSLVILWHNGLGPKKVEENINFTVVNTAGFVFFSDNSNNEEYKFAESAIKSLAVIKSISGNGSGIYKMSFSKYTSTKPYYTDAIVKISGKEETYRFEKCEDINLIAIQSHQDRKSRQLSKALVRLAVRETLKTASRKLIEESVDRATDYAMLGDIAGLIVELTFDALANKLEKADLRQWYSLPHSIYYTRIPIDSASQEVIFVASGKRKYKKTFPMEVSKGETVFKIIRTQGSRESDIKH